MEKKKILERLKPSGWEKDIGEIEELAEALESWELVLDTIGFLSINTSLRNN